MQRESLNGSCQSPLKRAAQLQPWRSICETSTGKSPNHFTLFLHSVCLVFHLYFVVFTFTISPLQLLVTINFFFSNIGNTISAAGFWQLIVKICSELEYWLLSYQWLFMQRYGLQLIEWFTVSQKRGTVCFILNEKWHPCTEMKMNTESFPADMQSNSR